MLNISSGEDETDNMELRHTVGMKESAQLTVIALQSCRCLGQQAQDDPRSANVRISHTVVSLSSSEAFDQRLSPTTPVPSICVDNLGKWKRGRKEEIFDKRNIRHHSESPLQISALHGRIEKHYLDERTGHDEIDALYETEITEILTVVFD
jgi:hypothetical protein